MNLACYILDVSYLFRVYLPKRVNGVCASPNIKRYPSPLKRAAAEQRKELAELCWRYDIARLEVFGSAARGTDFDLEKKSDPDFLVELDPRQPAAFLPSVL